MAKQTLREVATLPAFKGFLYQWYDTSTGHVILNPGQGDCPSTGGTVRQLLVRLQRRQRVVRLGPRRRASRRCPGRAKQAAALLAKMDFSLFYDDRAETHCNVNRDVQGNQPTGQMYGGYYAGNPPDVGDNWTHYYHNGALYSDPRISAYLGMGRGEMPGNVWWRSWRELPPAGAVRRLRGRPGLLLAGPVADGRVLAEGHRPAVRARCSTSGRAATPTPAPT